MRSTPQGGLGRKTPDESVIAIADLRGSAAILRALALLVDHLTRGENIREPLRQLIARARSATLSLRIENGMLMLEGVSIDPASIRNDPTMLALQQRFDELSVETLLIRDGAAAGELMALARLLSGGPDAHEQWPLSSETPTATATLSEQEHASDHRELLRTWSVLVLRTMSDERLLAQALPPGGPFARLTSARTDDAARQAVGALIEMANDAAPRGDAMTIEHVARAIASAIPVTGSGAGRLSLEGGIRQLLRPELVRLLAQRVPTTIDRNSLLPILSRAGDVAVSALGDLLMNAPAANDRRAYFDAIVALDVGGTLLRRSLQDPRWFVVRNAAALLGEMGVADADAELVALLDSDDERIRVAAARALLRLRTPRGIAALHSRVSDTSAEIRRIAATSHSIAATTSGLVRPTAARLAAAVDIETDEEVALEMLTALGRLGSADAVQRLLRIAQSPTIDTPAAIRASERGYQPRSSWMRVAALEALVEARGSGGAVLSTVHALANDSDALVRDTALRLKAVM